MQLTNYIREAFVKAAMQDVPKVDYDEEMRAIINKIVFDTYPLTLQKFIKTSDPILDWFGMRSSSMYGMSYSYYANTKSVFGSQKLNIEDIASKDPRLTELHKKKTEQDTKLRELEKKLKGVAYGCNTRKQLVEALPEFEKYLPAEKDKPMRSLPVVANVVTEFIQAGWPKGQKPQEASPVPAVKKPTANKSKKTLAKQTI